MSARRLRPRRASRLRATLACAALALLATTLVGCPVGPNYVRPDAQPPTEFYGQLTPPEAESLADLPWWEVFSDPVLQRLVTEAVQNNYDLRTAIARVEQAEALVGVARAPLFPQIGYQGQASRQRQLVIPGVPSRTFNAFLGAFDLAWEIDVWGRIRRATEAAQAELLATEEFRRGVLLTLVASVAQAYFELLELDRELEIARQTTESFRETLELFTRRYQGGVGSKLQTERAAAALYETEASIPTLEAQIVAKENQINVLLGRNPGPIPRGASLTEQVTPPTTPPGLPADLLERRPDVRQAEAVIQSANAQVGVAVANFFPRIGLTSLYGGQSTELEDVVKGSANIWNIVGSISGPIFTGGQLLEQYYAQVAQWEQAKLQWEQTLLTAFAEVSSTLVLQQKLAEIREAQAKAVRAYEESVRLSLLRYNQGLANYYEVLEAQQLLFPAQLDLARTQRDQLLAVVDLYRALGGGWQLPDDAWIGPVQDVSAAQP
ncbi:MAG TPA: efflux transporter outer membrane subunit [Candidatus Binatia bacterium]